jgi:hypothetical protein
LPKWDKAGQKAVPVATSGTHERPRQFCLDEDVFQIAEIETRWYDPNGEYFRVRTSDGKRYILHSDRETGQWTLLLARPGIEVVSVELANIRTAELKLAGCERCRNDESEIPFNFVIADVLEKHGAFDFILSEPGRCPNCNAELSERTLVELQGGIEQEVEIR